MTTRKTFFSSAAIGFIFFMLLSASCTKKGCPTATTTLVLESAKDAWICNRPDYADRNFGDHEEILAEGWTVNGSPLIVRSLLAFDLSAVPEGARIIEAKLFLQSVDNTTNGPGHSQLTGSNEAVIKWITGEWNKNSVTWNNQPATTDAKRIDLPASKTDLQNYEIDVTEMVKAMLEKKEISHGFMLMMQNETSYRRVLFASGDHDIPSKWPRLIIKTRHKNS